ncbi:hypothetical protein E2C01_044477 [Portunus trituberculatus]|uniref:Uncharacterized protein n=1 Tax=Portunus trituberculatus TaxID=210409 RepID=A0A5B7FZG2_PORTR|nr:hypothetical protein [Portunus trituberculatus]
MNGVTYSPLSSRLRIRYEYKQGEQKAATQDHGAASCRFKRLMGSLGAVRYDPACLTRRLDRDRGLSHLASRSPQVGVAAVALAMHKATALPPCKTKVSSPRCRLPTRRWMSVDLVMIEGPCTRSTPIRPHAALSTSQPTNHFLHRCRTTELRRTSSRDRYKSNGFEATRRVSDVVRPCSAAPQCTEKRNVHVTPVCVCVCVCV